MRILAVAIAMMLVPGAAAAWTSFHADALNTGHTTSDYSPFVDVWWNVKLDGDPASTDPAVAADAASPITASPIVKDGVLVIGDWAGRLRALDTESGGELWRYQMPGKISATAAMDGNKVFAVDEGGNLMAFDLQTGVKLIETPVAVGATRASPAIHEGKLYIGNEAGEIKAYDTATLTLDWKFVISEVQDKYTPAGENTAASCADAHPVGPIRGSPVVYDEKVIFGALNDYVYAVDANGNPDGTANIVWTFQSDDDIVASPTVNQGEDEVIIASYDGKVYALDATPSGSSNECHGIKITSKAWQFEVSGSSATRIQSSPATDGNYVYFGTPDNNIYALDARTGKQVWAIATGDDVNSSPAVAGGYVIVGSNDDKVYWLSAADGSTIKTFRTANSVEASPAIDNNRAFIASFDGSIYMLGPEIPHRPDLIVSDATADKSSIMVTIRNQDNGDASANVLRLEVNGALLTFLDVPAMNGGGQQTLTYATALGNGTHTIVAHVDFNQTVIESDEGNNKFETTVNLDPAPAPSAKKDKEGIPAPAAVWLLVGLAVLMRRRR